ncbi:aldo/keto reductase [Vagococcus carniphilus]|uniref:aldo/keto reductase n=1 Tax=Vagococcus carniphilus TaxID=218144 RepID=UPI003B5C4B26
MRNIELGSTSIEVPQVALGCMRMSDLTLKDAVAVLETSLDHGINFFDHADIYGKGEAEKKFAQAIKEMAVPREKIMIQSKCGIRDGFYDFSKEHILKSVDGILERLETDYLDVLALHRPDTLMEPTEIAEAFDKLQSTGKVRHFGVSNQGPMQIELIERSLNQKLVVNQLQFGLKHAGMVAYGMNGNMENEAGIYRDGGILEYSRLKEMTIQAWSPYQYGYFDGVFLGNNDFKELNDVIEEMAQKYGVTDTGIATAWINRHPANIQTIIGTMNPQRIEAVALASEIELSREDWYRLYQASGYLLL